MVARFGFIKEKKGAWEIVKTSNGPWMQYTDHEQALAEKDLQYQQLVGQAVGFAENMIYVMGALVGTREELEDNGHVIASRKFLTSPAVQQWRKEHQP